MQTKTIIEEVQNDFYLPAEVQGQKVSYSLSSTPYLRQQNNQFFYQGIFTKSQDIKITAFFERDFLLYKTILNLAIKPKPTFTITITTPQLVSINNLDNVPHLKVDDTYTFYQGQVLSFHLKKKDCLLFINDTNETTQIDKQTYSLTPSNNTNYQVKVQENIKLTCNFNGAIFDGQKSKNIFLSDAKMINLTDLPQLSKTGYRHTGWKIGSKPVTFPYNVTKNTTLTASFIKTYQLSINLDGGSIASTLPETYDTGAEVTLPTPQKDGYRFLKYINAKTGGEVSSPLVVSTNITLTALYQKEWQITIDFAGGLYKGQDSLTFKQDHGTTYLLVIKPLKNNYRFLSYQDQDNNSYSLGSVITINRDIKLTACYQKQVKVTITSPNPAFGSTTEVFAQGVTLTPDMLSLPYLDNQHTFSGFYLDIALNNPLTSIILNDDYILYAKFDEVLVTLTLKLPVNATLNGEGGPFVKQYLIYTDCEQPSDPVDGGGVPFMGWFDENDELRTLPLKMTRNLTLTACFGNSYQVTFRLNGGQVNGHDTYGPIIVTSKKPYLLPITPQKANARFLHFTLDDMSVFDFANPVTANLVLTAQYIKQFRVTFNFNGGFLDNNSTLTLVCDENFSLADIGMPQREHYLFRGFYNSELPTLTFPLIITKDFIFNTRWEIKTYQISFAYNGGKDSDGNISKAPLNLAYGANLTNPGVLTKEGETFLGWFINNQPVIFPYQVVGDIELGARFGVVVEVIYDLDGGLINGQGHKDTEYLLLNSQINALPNPVKTGQIFKGWYVGANKIEFPYVLNTPGSITIKAKYEGALNPGYPDGYYDAVDGITDKEQLVKELHKLINKTINRRSYNEVRYDLEKVDEDPAKPGYVLGMYDRVHYPNKWTGGKPWNREHVWPNSKLGVGRVQGSERNIASDLHNLRACNASVNSTRNNHHYVSMPLPESETGRLVNGKWFPGKYDKGDAARILLFMAVAYKDNLKLKKVPADHPTYQPAGAQMGDLTQLLLWHKSDSVDNFEISRNNKIAARQKNRNPFIDRPDLFEPVWQYFMDLEHISYSLQQSNFYTTYFYQKVKGQVVITSKFD